MCAKKKTAKKKVAPKSSKKAAPAPSKKAAPKTEQLKLETIKGEIEFPKKGNIMLLLGEVYEDIRDALGEFISNAEDAEAKKINIHLQGKRRIIIEDNGLGMSREDMERVPTHVGDSIRALQQGKVGEKGIGILGFQAFADRMTIISRARGSRETWRLALVAGTPSFKISRVKEGLPRSGTEVVISGIRGKQTRVFSKKAILGWLQSKYRVALQEKRFKLSLLDATEQITIRPSAYQGSQFKVKALKTEFGAVKPSIFIAPLASNVRVGVTYKGRMIIPSITTLPEFNRSPWNSGKVQGEIPADFCRQTTGRGGLVHDDARYDAWVEAIRTIEPELEAAITDAERDAADATDMVVFGRMNKALNRALREFEEIEALLTQVQRTAIGRGPTLGKKTKGGSTSKPGPAGKLLKKTQARGFSWEMEDFAETEAHLHSAYDKALSIVRINRLHPDFERESDTPQARERYLIKLTTKELALTLYPGISREDQLEKMVQLELCMNRNL